MTDFDLKAIAPDALKAMFALQQYVDRSKLDRTLVRLVEVRASQINGCAYCLDMHTKNARQEGETEQRLYALNAWRETPFFTEKERVALAWAERLTLMADGHISDEMLRQARALFTDAELVDLSMAIVVINGWNRLVPTFGPEAGTYKPTQEPASSK